MTPEQLERELTATKAQLDDIRQHLKGHPDSQLDGESGLAAATMRGFEALQLENEAMREVIKVAHDAFNFISSNWTEQNLEKGETIRRVFHAEKINVAKDALTELTPFLR